MTLSRGDVVLLDVPYSDQTGIKRRPAVVVCNAGYLAGCSDVIIQPITSKTNVPVRFPGVCEIVDWREAGLLNPSLVKGQLWTFNRGMIRKRFGRLSVADLERMDKNLAGILFDQPRV